jgi:hypothetical protein
MKWKHCPSRLNCRASTRSGSSECGAGHQDSGSDTSRDAQSGVQQAGSHQLPQDLLARNRVAGAVVAPLSTEQLVRLGFDDAMTLGDEGVGRRGSQGDGRCEDEGEASVSHVLDTLGDLITASRRDDAMTARARLSRQARRQLLR